MKVLKIIGVEIFLVIFATQSTLESSSQRSDRIGGREEQALANHAQLKDSVTNLVILNDIYEMRSADEFIPGDIESFIPGAMWAELIDALYEDCLVLCPIVLWLSIQNFIRLIDSFTDTKFVKAHVMKNFNLYEDWFIFIKNFHKRMKASRSDSDKKVLIKDFEKKIEKLKQADTDNLSGKPIRAGCFYIMYQEILAKEYDCRQIGAYFLLFVPKGITHSLVLRQDYARKLLTPYDYKDMTPERFQVYYFEKIRYKPLGEILLNALNVIQPEKDALMNRSSFLNVYLSGHGSPDEKISGISIKPKSFDKNSIKSSDFLRILNCFNNNFNTKSLAISSCYTGGKKIIDAYNLDNKFNNAVLENINFPIINFGSTFEESYSFIYGPSPEHIIAILNNSKERRLQSYFSLINEVPPKYQEATAILARKFKENYASIRLPHTSWFSPVQYKEKETVTSWFSPVQYKEKETVKELSQVAMSTMDKPIKISKDIKTILLGANYIPQPLIIGAVSQSSLPDLLPVNYHNQNYYFDSLQLELDGSFGFNFHNILTGLLGSNIKEPINIVFKEIKIQVGSSFKKYTNVYYFMHKKITLASYADTYYFTSQMKNSPAVYKSGYIYTDINFETKIVSWNSNEPAPILPEEKLFDKTQFISLIDTIEAKVKEGLSPALKAEFLDDLSQRLGQRTRSVKVETREDRSVKA